MFFYYFSVYIVTDYTKHTFIIFPCNLINSWSLSKYSEESDIKWRGRKRVIFGLIKLTYALAPTFYLRIMSRNKYLGNVVIWMANKSFQTLITVIIIFLRKKKFKRNQFNFLF